MKVGKARVLLSASLGMHIGGSGNRTVVERQLAVWKVWFRVLRQQFLTERQ
jgi:hypothetical protein